jgi:hypothetical protein
MPEEFTPPDGVNPQAWVAEWATQMAESANAYDSYAEWLGAVTSDAQNQLAAFSGQALTIDEDDFNDWAAQNIPDQAAARYEVPYNLRDVFDGGTPGADYRRLYLELQLIGDEAWASAVASNSALPLESRLTTSQLYQEAMAAPGNGDPGDALFDLIDRNNDGHISHAEYFGFQEYLLPQGVPPGDSQYAGDWSDNARGWADEVGGQMAAAGSYETWADSLAIITADALFSINNADDGTSPDGSGDGSGAQSDVAPGPAETNGDAGAGNDVVAPPLTPLELYQRADEFYNGIFLGGYLDQAEIQYVFAAFPPALLVHYDGDGDGQLSHDELAQALTHARSSASYEEWTAEFDSGSNGAAPIFSVGSDEIEIRSGADNEAPAPGFESDDDGQFGADAGDGEDLDAV